MLESGWVIKFEDGSKELMTEQVFAEFSVGMHPRAKEKVVSETHYFDILVAVDENPDAPVSY